MRGQIIGLLSKICLLLLLGVSAFAASEDLLLINPPQQSIPESPPGDRVKCELGNLNEWIPAAFSGAEYRIGPGDTLSINVQGKATLSYKARPDAKAGESPDEVTVTPGGDIYLPLAGKIQAAGKTVSELEDTIRQRLSTYIKHFEVSVAVSNVRTINVWISGEVENAGPRILPAVCTASLAALQAQIKPTGSTRRIEVIRNGSKKIVDLYKIIVTGNPQNDICLEPGDTLHVPAVTDYLEVTGEVTRPGRYEMVSLDGKTDEFTVSDLISLALGTTPAAARDKAFIERIGEDGRKFAINVNLLSKTDDIALKPGDVLVVPSISAFQPIVRLIGEFKGDGVYQRAPGSTTTDIENKSGIYFLKQGQTVKNVITATGGVTPQADLKRARIERFENGVLKNIPVDLERLLLQNDDTADVVLQNGDSLVLPALADKIHVFGEVKKPGSYIYSPNRRLVDYLGDAGGTTDIAKLTEVSIVRGGFEKPIILKVNAKQAIMRGTIKSNPVLEPGDIIYVPSKFIGGWRDAMQMVFSSLSLITLFRRL